MSRSRHVDESRQSWKNFSRKQTSQSSFEKVNNRRISIKMKSMVLLFIVVVHFATGVALKCWDCSGPGNGACGDPFDKSGNGVKEETCKQGQNQCVIQVFLHNPNKWTYRGCQDPYHISPETNSSINSGKQHIEFCSTDLCNGAKSVSPKIRKPLLCYKCGSPRGEPCAGPFYKFSKHVEKLKCPDAQARCVTKVWLNGSYTTRRCEMAWDTDAVTNASIERGKQQIYFCDRDLCNGAKSARGATIYTNYIFMMALATLLVLINFY